MLRRVCCIIFPFEQYLQGDLFKRLLFFGYLIDLIPNKIAIRTKSIYPITRFEYIVTPVPLTGDIAAAAPLSIPTLHHFIFKFGVIEMQFSI